MLSPRLSILILVVSFSQTICASSEDNRSIPQARRVMTWVPPYGIDASKKMLTAEFNGIGAKNGITHVGLQFWDLSDEGKLRIVKKFKGINDATVASFRQWGDANDIKIMLCVYNGTSGWDWSVARLAFETNRKAFIDALVNETLRLGLDGIDIDFEAKGQQKDSKQAYIAFIKELAARLHAKGKELTVDTFAYKWNAPNQSWWPELLPHLDALHVMGYTETGANAEGWRSYQAMKTAGGPYAHKLALGVPSNSAKWQGIDLDKNLQWLVNDGTVSLAIWDARLLAPEWQTKKTWQTIGQMKGSVVRSHK